MKRAIMPKEPTWWVWLVLVATLAAGLAAHVAGFIAAIALSLAAFRLICGRDSGNSRADPLW